MAATQDAHIVIAAGQTEATVSWVRELEGLGHTTSLVATPEELRGSLRRGHLLLHGEGFHEDPAGLVSGLREDGFAGEVVVVTATPSVAEAAALMGVGCADYLPASLSVPQLVARACEAMGLLEGSHPQFGLLWRTFRKHTGWEHVQSGSDACRHVYRQGAQAAPSSATVLIEGETGTGKEYLARAVHFMSPRRDKPFVAVNCGAIPETLLESELFGHERGAFTSATRAKPGLCETAHRGTIFLDEIGDMSMAMQVKLLRFVQDKSLVRVGGLETVKVDVRIIAATNQDLRRAVREGRFREDLYYRLAVINLHLPPLRDCGQDVRCFADYFLAKYQTLPGRKLFCDCAYDRLKVHQWPGNLRELENVVQRAILTTPHRTIHAESIEILEPLLMDVPLRLFPLTAV